jgi:hypothetical protein
MEEGEWEERVGASDDGKKFLVGMVTVDCNKNISDSNSESGQELTKSLELHIKTTPTPDKPQIIMSYAATIIKTSMAQGHSGTTPFSTVGAARGTPDWPTDSGGDQIMQGSRNSQVRSTDVGQGAPNWPAD